MQVPLCQKYCFHLLGCQNQRGLCPTGNACWSFFGIWLIRFCFRLHFHPCILLIESLQTPSIVRRVACGHLQSPRFCKHSNILWLQPCFHSWTERHPWMNLNTTGRWVYIITATIMPSPSLRCNMASPCSSLHPNCFFGSGRTDSRTCNRTGMCDFASWMILLQFHCVMLSTVTSLDRQDLRGIYLPLF